MAAIYRVEHSSSSRQIITRRTLWLENNAPLILTLPSAPTVSLPSQMLSDEDLLKYTPLAINDIALTNGWTQIETEGILRKRCLLQKRRYYRMQRAKRVQLYEKERAIQQQAKADMADVTDVNMTRICATATTTTTDAVQDDQIEKAAQILMSMRYGQA